jgi:DNA-binding SARP family transcriptional activator/tetratricopeptide (TPR) repeat protein
MHKALSRIRPYQSRLTQHNPIGTFSEEVGATMDFRILGPLEVATDGQALTLGAAKQQVVLAVLLLHPNEVVSPSRLVDELWGEAPPATAAKVVQGYVSGLRKILGAQTIITGAGGYSVRIEPDCLDAARFESLTAEGRAFLPNDPARAVEVFRRALGLWRGPPLAGLALMSVARSETQRLVEAQLTAVEQRIEGELVLSRHPDLVQQLTKLVAENPYREQLRAHLMLALYRCGRQVEALAAFRDARQVLVRELGIEPSRELQQLQERMLAHDPALDSPLRAEAAADRVQVHQQRVDSARRLVTVAAIFMRIKGLGVDPESMHRIAEEHSAMCRDIIQRHGGSVQGYGGNTVTAVFGLADVHEDDAPRAVRAAVEIRDAVAEANDALERDFGVGITVTIGIESGWVFVGAGTPQERLATGDAVELAAALAQGGGSDGEILLGERARHLGGPMLSLDAMESVSLPNRTDAVSRWRLQGLQLDEPVRAGSGVYIGHQRELKELRAALARAATESSCRLVTILGPAGIGKSRLTREFLSDLDIDAAVVVGHCLSYGEGITYHPLAEIVGQLSGGDLDTGLVELLSGEPNADSIELQVLAAVGRSRESVQPEETFWAVRRLFEWAARERPLIVVIDDIHWAEPNLLDMLDHVVTFSRGAPILVVCLARLEFLEAVPSWAVPQQNRSILALDPLDKGESHELVGALDAGANLGLDERRRAVEAAEGNPFFLEQIVAVSATGVDTSVPLSVHALLAARIDRLQPGERNLLGLAAVGGRSFRRHDLAGLMEEVDRRDIDMHLATLVHKQLIGPGHPKIYGKDTFRFAHVLIREAAYDAMPKQLRADLHAKMANQLKATASPQAELVGYHLEQAYRFCAELAPIRDRERALATEAAEWLDAAARAAFLRGDLAGGAGLMERAVSLFPPGDVRRLSLLPGLGEALFEAGRLKDAERVLDEAIRHAHAEDASELAARASVERQRVLIQEGSAWSVAEAEHVADVAIDVLGKSGDQFGQCRAWCLRATVKWILGLAFDADQAWMRAAEHGQRSGSTRELFEILGWRASAAVCGPTPVDAAIRQCYEIRDQVGSSPVAVADMLHPLATLHAMKGDFLLARGLIREAHVILDDLGRLESAVSHYEATVELLAGDAATAESKLLAGYRKLEAMGERSLLATTAAMLAQAVLLQGRLDEADEYCRVSESTAAADDVTAQAKWRGVRARILAERGEFEGAESRAREAVRLASTTDFTTVRADSYVDLGTVLDRAGRTLEAETAVRRALELYDQKGDIVSADRARSWLVVRGSAVISHE